MKITDLDFLSKLETIHDEIKAHPFRLGFEDEYVVDYKRLLYNITEIWADFIYKKAHKPEDQRILVHFGRWIHDFRSYLFPMKSKEFKMEFFDYYEKMLNVMHNIIRTSDVTEYYDFVWVWNDNGEHMISVDLFELISSNECGFDSEALPTFLPRSYSITCDPEVIRKYIYDEEFRTRSLSDGDKAKIFEAWERDKLPVIQWSNSRHKETDYKFKSWFAYKGI